MNKKFKKITSFATIIILSITAQIYAECHLKNKIESFEPHPEGLSAWLKENTVNSDCYLPIGKIYFDASQKVRDSEKKNDYLVIAKGYLKFAVDNMDKSDQVNYQLCVRLYIQTQCLLKPPDLNEILLYVKKAPFLKPFDNQSIIENMKPFISALNDQSEDYNRLIKILGNQNNSINQPTQTLTNTRRQATSSQTTGQAILPGQENGLPQMAHPTTEQGKPQNNVVQEAEQRVPQRIRINRVDNEEPAAETTTPENAHNIGYNVMNNHAYNNDTTAQHQKNLARPNAASQQRQNLTPQIQQQELQRQQVYQQRTQIAHQSAPIQIQNTHLSMEEQLSQFENYAQNFKNKNESYDCDQMRMIVDLRISGTEIDDCIESYINLIFPVREQSDEYFYRFYYAWAQIRKAQDSINNWVDNLALAYSKATREDQKTTIQMELKQAKRICDNRGIGLNRDVLQKLSDFGLIDIFNDNPISQTIVFNSLDEARKISSRLQQYSKAQCNDNKRQLMFFMHSLIDQFRDTKNNDYFYVYLNLTRRCICFTIEELSMYDERMISNIR